MQVWVKQVREEANRIEEIIDEYLNFVEAEKHHRQRGCINCFHKACGFVKDLKQRHDVASKIQDVKDSLREIKDRGQGYGLRPLEQGASSTTTNVEAPIDPRLGSLFIEKDEFVGLETESHALIRKLVEGSSTRSVISLVGKGGIGKTTLAKKVYDDEVVKGNFEEAAKGHEKTNVIPNFRNLCGLQLSSSWLINDPCKCLKVLPNLVSLGLERNACVGEQLHFEKCGFEKLKVLWLEELDALEHIEIDEGALPALEMLGLFYCPLLKEVPSVKHLTKLKHFEIDEIRVLNWN